MPVHTALDLDSLAREILEVATAQTHAIETDDYAELEHLSHQRDELQQILSSVPTGSSGLDALSVLQRVLEIDAKNARIVRTQITETSHQMSQTQHAHAALRGYRPPTGEPFSALIDTQR
jgi:hypothetical protein